MSHDKVEGFGLGEAEARLHSVEEKRRCGCPLGEEREGREGCYEPSAMLVIAAKP